MTKPSIHANSFNVSDSQTTIDFASTSFSGKPTFSYRVGQTHLQFTGQDIRIVEAEFGKLVTVTIGGEGDAGVSTVTLLVPQVSLRTANDVVEFNTVATLTEQRRLGPVHQHYTGLNLHGTARQITF
jgi:hypothetical protein